MPIVLNVKSQVKVRLKIFYRLLGLFYIAFALNATIKTVFFFLEIFVHPSNNRVVYGPEPNL